MAEHGWSKSDMQARGEQHWTSSARTSTLTVCVMNCLWTHFPDRSISVARTVPAAISLSTTVTRSAAPSLSHHDPPAIRPSDPSARDESASHPSASRSHPGDSRKQPAPPQHRRPPISTTRTTHHTVRHPSTASRRSRGRRPNRNLRSGWLLHVRTSRDPQRVLGRDGVLMRLSPLAAS